MKNTFGDSGSGFGFLQLFEYGSGSEKNAESCRSRIRHPGSVATSALLLVGMLGFQNSSI